MIDLCLSYLKGVLCFENEDTYRVLQSVGAMYEFHPTNEKHHGNRRNCFVIIGSHVNQHSLEEQFRKCLSSSATSTECMVHQSMQ